MDRKKFLHPGSQTEFYNSVLSLHQTLDDAFLEKHKRSLPFADTLFDRWDRAKKLGFGEGTSIYDSSLIIGDVMVGSNCWIGPFSIIDGSGGLKIGNYCTISAGVHIYSHDNVKQTLSSGSISIERSPVKIDNNVYLAPNVIVVKGITIGPFCVVGTNTFVNKNIPSHSIVLGNPGKVVGKVKFRENGEIEYDYT